MSFSFFICHIKKYNTHLTWILLYIIFVVKSTSLNMTVQKTGFHISSSKKYDFASSSANCMPTDIKSKHTPVFKYSIIVSNCLLMVKTKQEFMLYNHVLSSNKQLCSDFIQISH